MKKALLKELDPESAKLTTGKEALQRVVDSAQATSLVANRLSMLPALEYQNEPANI